MPAIGCTCDVCRSPDPRDKRLRPSIYIAVTGGPSILVDAGPDLRQQALVHGLTRVDAILFTHSHADHTMGLDEVRRFNALQKSSIPVYADERTEADLRRVFEYIFSPTTDKAGGIPQIDLRPITGAFDVNGVHVIPVPLLHGSRPILGFRLGHFAYLTDCNGIPESSWPLLNGVEILVLDALRHRPHPTHFTVAEAIGVIERMAPQRAMLTHICHDLPHAATNASLPAGVELAYDGLSFEIAVT